MVELMKSDSVEVRIEKIYIVSGRLTIIWIKISTMPGVKVSGEEPGKDFQGGL
jgi:hypothetical protein